MSDKIIPVSYQGLSTEFCINPHLAQDVNFKPVAIKEKERALALRSIEYTNVAKPSKYILQDLRRNRSL